jgi:hypothetical protein
LIHSAGFSRRGKTKISDL